MLVLVPDVRVELTTRSSSGYCSTDELIRLGLLGLVEFVLPFETLFLVLSKANFIRFRISDSSSLESNFIPSLLKHCTTQLKYWSLNWFESSVFLIIALTRRLIRFLLLAFLKIFLLIIKQNLKSLTFDRDKTSLKNLLFWKYLLLKLKIISFSSVKRCLKGSIHR